MKQNETTQREDVDEVGGKGRLVLRKGKDKVLVEHYNGWGSLSSSLTVGLRDLTNAVEALGGKG